MSNEARFTLPFYLGAKLRALIVYMTVKLRRCSASSCNFKCCVRRRSAWCVVGNVSTRGILSATPCDLRKVVPAARIWCVVDDRPRSALWIMGRRVSSSCVWVCVMECCVRVRLFHFKASSVRRRRHRAEARGASV